MSPDEFFSLTPYQIFSMFFREKPDPNAKTPDIDNIAFLKSINLYRASIGKPPQTPDWFLKEVPRGR